MDFTWCHSGHTCFIRRRSDSRCMFLSISVDDIIITRDDEPGIIAVKQALGQSFDIKDLGHLRYFLGIEIARSRSGICLSQWKYSLDLLQYTDMMGCRPASTPMDSNLKLSIESGELLSDASHISVFLVLLSIWSTLVQILHLLLVLWASLCMLLVHLTLMLFITSFGILIYVLALGYSTVQMLRMRCNASLMQIMQVQRVTYALPLDYVHSMTATFCQGKVRSRLLCLILQLKLNIELWLRVYVNYSGFARSWQNWVFPWILRLPCSVTISLL